MVDIKSKRLREAKNLIDRTKSYSLNEAISLLKKFPAPKFDESVDVSIRLNIDPKEITQSIRGSVVLPHGRGKKVRVAVFCKGQYLTQAKEAGADIVGEAELIEKVNNGFLDFDIAIATPDMMREMGTLGKILGPRGLMPSPKSGTVTQDVAKAIKDVKTGKVEFRMDKLGCINMAVGKRSFSEEAIFENIQRLLEAVTQVRPPQVKGRFLKSISISTTMGPGIRLDVSTY